MMRSRPSLAARRPLRRRPQRRFGLYLTAAAAFGSSFSSNAFSPAPRIDHSLWRHSSPFLWKTPSPAPLSPFTTTTRLFSSSNSDNAGILSKLKGAAKSILPKKWFQTDEEKQAALERKRVKQEVKGSIQQVLKDAPLPVKMLGGMIAPLLSSVMSTVAEQVGEQQRAMDALLEDARVYLVRDFVASQALGEPITVSAPFSQSSSTVMINGKTTTNIQATFNVMGSKSSGVARMDATEAGITSLVLDVNGRPIRVNISSSSGSEVGDSSYYKKTSLGKNPKNAGDIIDVEFVEKKDDTSNK